MKRPDMAIVHAELIPFQTPDVAIVHAEFIPFKRPEVAIVNRTYNFICAYIYIFAFGKQPAEVQAT